MKLTRLPAHEKTVKHSFAFRQSTASLLQQYQEMYKEVTGADVPLKDVVEQMLLDFMTDDKAFQKRLRQKLEAEQAAAAGAEAAAASASAAAETTAQHQSSRNADSHRSDAGRTPATETPSE
jgi:hypothetical protein